LTGKAKSERPIGEKKASKRAEQDNHLDRRLVAFGGDGNTLVVGTATGVTVQAVDTGKERFRLDPASALCLSPDGKRMATVVRSDKGDKADDALTIWNMGDGKSLVRFSVPAYSGGRTMAFKDDGRTLVTGGFEPILHLWDVGTGKLFGTIDLPFRADVVIFDPPGKRLAAGFADTTVLIYDVAAALKPAPKE